MNLEVRNLSTYFYTEAGIVKAVDDLSLSVKPGEILGLVGESGSGKSTVAYSILRLISPPGQIVSGEIFWQGKDLLKLKEEEMRTIRGKEISIIFQDPFVSLNPVLNIGDQIAEVIELHQRVDKQTAWQKAIELLKLVQIPDAETRARQYPHEFSGGMRQRVMIAMAVACKPKLLIADEPTTALDVTIQAQILYLLKDLQKKFNLSVLYITHNLAVIAEICDRVAVMYAGKIVEEAEVHTLFKNPSHPYTKKLLGSVLYVRS